jgi:hypothetical protein
MMKLDEREPDLKLVKFTAADRCDRCGAQAYALAQREDMPQPLLFCGHHRKRHFDALVENDWLVVDDYEAWERIANGDLTAATVD